MLPDGRTSADQPAAGPADGILYRRALLGGRAAAWLLDGTASARAGAIVLLDVDAMRVVNHRFGTEVGDRLLAAIEPALQEVLAGRGGATPFGGDQFLAVVIGAHRWPALVRALRRAVRRIRVGPASLTVSAGFCAWSGNRPAASRLVAEAARSLERAKARRR